MNSAVLIFIKYPVPGKVKTRLGATIGYEQAARFYKAFVEDIISGLDNAAMKLVFFYDPFQPVERYQKWLGDRTFIPQSGSDLGGRMHNAFASAFLNGHDRCVLIGSDLPGLNPRYVQQGLEALKKAPACIGPASDGGYYQIGFKKNYLNRYVFEDMEWSTERVYTESISRMHKLQLNPAILPEFSDIDTIDDLQGLFDSSEIIERCPVTYELFSHLNYPLTE